MSEVHHKRSQVSCSANLAHQRPSGGTGGSCSNSSKELGIAWLRASQHTHDRGYLGCTQLFNAELFWGVAIRSPDSPTWSLVGRLELEGDF